MNPIDIRDISIGGEIGRRIAITAKNNMLAVDVQTDFLKPFVDRNADSGYVGLGHFIDGLTRIAYHLHTPEIISFKNGVVADIIATAEESGYIGLLTVDHRLSQLWDVHEMSHLIYGFTADFRYWGNQGSLDAAIGLAEYLITGWEAHPGDINRQFVMSTLDCEHAMISLYEMTDDDRYLQFCINTLKIHEWDRPIVEGRWHRIEGHIYDYLSRCLAQLRLTDLQPQLELTKTSDRAMEYMLRGDGMTITGEAGDHECWHSSQEGTVHLGETCATAYTFRLLDVLLRSTGKALYGDVMERVLVNALFAAQSPDGRHLRYYTPFDGPRSYFPRDTYCCPSNFRRIVSELPGSIIYTEDSGVVINQYVDCTAQLPIGGGISLTTATKYPSDGTVAIRIGTEATQEFTIRFRIPTWCKSAAISINGADISARTEPGSFFAIRRSWQDNDTVEVIFDMSIRLIRGRKAQTDRVAVMYGPTVFCLNPTLNPTTKEVDLRNLVIDPNSIEGPFPDTSVRPNGLCLQLRAWGPDTWYPVEGPNFTLTLTEFADPDGMATYFRTPVPSDPRIEDDELLSGDVQVAQQDYYGQILLQDQTDIQGGEILSRLQS